MKKRFSILGAVVFAVVIFSGCDPDANDPSVDFVIDNQSNYDLFDVKL